MSIMMFDSLSNVWVQCETDVRRLWEKHQRLYIYFNSML
jgi:hypothetical protein